MIFLVSEIEMFIINIESLLDKLNRKSYKKCKGFVHTLFCHSIALF